MALIPLDVLVNWGKLSMCEAGANFLQFIIDGVFRKVVNINVDVA